jgi:hypothetical protein
MVVPGSRASQASEEAFACLTLAMQDMIEVERVSQLLLDHDPDINPMGPLSLPARNIVAHPRQFDARARVARSFYVALGDPSLRTVIETGLIVTYARPFTEGRGSGFPLDTKLFVPSAGVRLHQQMMTLRRRVHAHVDAAAPPGFRRSVETEVRPGFSSVTFRGPRLLTADELTSVVALAADISGRLKAARDKL